MDRTNRFMALGSPAPKNIPAGAKITLARSTRLEASLYKSISERLGGVNMTYMLEAVREVIDHIDHCIEDQMTRPNFEPTDRFLEELRVLHRYTNVLATRVGGYTCTDRHADIVKHDSKERETQTEPEIPPRLSYAAIISQNIPPTPPAPKKSSTPSAQPLMKGKKVPTAPIPTNGQSSKPSKASEKATEKMTPPISIQNQKLPPTQEVNKPQTGKRQLSLPQSGRAIVVHGIATTKKLGKVRDWMEKANPWMGSIVAARWLLKKERREGKKTSSVVIYLKGEVESDGQKLAKVRLSGRWLHSELYEWNRVGTREKGKERDDRMDMDEAVVEEKEECSDRCEGRIICGNLFSYEINCPRHGRSYITPFR